MALIETLTFVLGIIYGYISLEGKIAVHYSGKD
ncbi:MAG: hypothetical protein MPEBLZ_02062 [Candidatus Methanoperedens nitroreducens]|uniref:Uncharacterized protein n=1 Tax=Candidatus Methanoperedens nitratireducens TaxID=1392998 RepID=A0A0P8A5G7_9EURY|nr:MAG: hypothetical protein MPEBLZ_02062 [Candidatus Methanoperedens sp. BLZ1]